MCDNITVLSKSELCDGKRLAYAAPVENIYSTERIRQRLLDFVWWHRTYYVLGSPSERYRQKREIISGDFGIPSYVGKKLGPISFAGHTCVWACEWKGMFFAIYLSIKGVSLEIDKRWATEQKAYDLIDMLTNMLTHYNPCSYGKVNKL